MRNVVAAFLLLCSLVAMGRPATAAVSIDVDLTSQTMHVYSPATGESFAWRVSTAASGFVTPHGVYHPQSLQVMHYSHKYHMSPMPHSIFFHGGYAIHGTYSVAELGRPASHGCIRLDPADATLLFGLVEAEGADIHITGTPPRGGVIYASAHHHGHRVHVAARRHHHVHLAAVRHHRVHLAAVHHRHHHRATAFAAHSAPAAAPLAYAPSRTPVPFNAWMHNPSRF